MKLGGQEEADHLIEVAGMLGLDMQKTQLIRSNHVRAGKSIEKQMEADVTALAATLGDKTQLIKSNQREVVVVGENNILSQNITKEKLSSCVDVNDIEPVKSAMKPVRVVLRGIVESNTCELCGHKFKDRNASKMHMRKKHREIHLKLTQLCEKVLHPTDNETCPVDFSNNIAEKRENTPEKGQGDSIKDEQQRSSNAVYSCILCDKNYRSQKNFNRHVRSKHARANQEALLNLTDTNEPGQNNDEKLEHEHAINKAQESIEDETTNVKDAPCINKTGERRVHFEEDIQHCSETAAEKEVAPEKGVVEDHEDALPAKDIVEAQEYDPPELLFEAAAEEFLLCEPDLEDELSETGDISEEKNNVENISEIVDVKPGLELEIVGKHEANDIICIGPVDEYKDRDETLSSSNVAVYSNIAESSSIVVDCCMLCGFAPRHQYVLWEHYLRHHFR